MKKITPGWLVLLLLGAITFCARAQIAVPSTYKQITVDGSFADWTGVPLAYTAAEGSTNAIQYDNIYIANDANNVYIRFTLYTPRAALQNSYDNIFVDGDDNPSTGFFVGGIGSSMLIQAGSGYQEKNGAFNEGAVNNLGWNLAGSSDNLDFELSISRTATFASDSTPVFASNTFAIFFEGDSTTYVNTEFAPPTGGLVYAFASPPAPPTTNESLISLTTTPWAANDAGSDLGTNWLGATYDDTGAGWSSGDGLFGYTSTPGAYPTIQTPLATTPNTYYFRSHFQWINDPANVAFVVTNYLSDGAVYYLNGTEVRRIRMPSGAISYATAATAANPAPGQPEVFGIDGGVLQYGDNLFEVETHQAPSSASDMVFGLSLTAAISYPVLIVNSNLPADQSILAGQSVTFASDILGSGPLSYQWFFGANPISGATASSYTIPLVLTNNAGLYLLQVSNSSSVVTTRAALLTISSTPVAITSEPASQIVVEGKPVTFSVGVSGTPLITYQWLSNSSPIWARPTHPTPSPPPPQPTPPLTL